MLKIITRYCLEGRCLYSQIPRNRREGPTQSHTGLSHREGGETWVRTFTIALADLAQ